MPNITLDDKTQHFPDGTSVKEAIDILFPRLRPPALAVKWRGTLRSLSWVPEEDAQLAMLNYTHEEGRRVYERSLRFLFLLACDGVLPGVRVRFEHSVGYGLYIRLIGQEPLPDDLPAQLTAQMRTLVRQNLPFVRERWSKDDAIRYFTKIGQVDTVRLLSYRPYTYFDLYNVLGRCEYFYGDMLPSTGYLKVFGIKRHGDGVVLQLPLPSNPNQVAPFAKRRKMMCAFEESRAWMDVLNCSNAADLNDLIHKNRMREFVRVNEALQENKIADIARQIMKKKARAIFIAGPSSSGKTTFTNRLAVQLRVLGAKPMLLSLDNYYKDIQDVPLDNDGKPDFECLESLDVPLLNQQLLDLFDGKKVETPRFSFHTNSRKDKGEWLQLTDDQPVLIEGIHGLNPALTGYLPRALTYKIYISALTTLNLDDHNRIRTTDARLLRRMVRDLQFRKTPAEQTLAMWASVRRGEELYIFPYQEQCDVMFNSALAYELSALKKYAYLPLTGITEDSPQYALSRRLLKFLSYFVEADIEMELAPTAILREFIGGCSFYLETH